LAGEGPNHGRSGSRGPIEEDDESGDRNYGHCDDGG
jgi:hypothetical protein